MEQRMSNANNALRQSALVMKIIGWGLILGLTLAAFLYSPGFLWGRLPAGFPQLGPAHPESPYDAFHPYIFMIAVLYLAWAILMIRGAKDPKANAALFDFGILANLFHALLMIPQAFIYPNEHAHFWADIPLLLLVCVILWIYHPNRVAAEVSTAL
jgi:hypothetical protein